MVSALVQKEKNAAGKCFPLLVNNRHDPAGASAFGYWRMRPELLRQAEARVEKITPDASGKPTGTEPRDVNLGGDANASERALPGLVWGRKRQAMSLHALCGVRIKGCNAAAPRWIDSIIAMRPFPATATP